MCNGVIIAPFGPVGHPNSCRPCNSTTVAWSLSRRAFPGISVGHPDAQRHGHWPIVVTPQTLEQMAPSRILLYRIGLQMCSAIVIGPPGSIGNPNSYGRYDPQQLNRFARSQVLSQPHNCWTVLLHFKFYGTVLVHRSATAWSLAHRALPGIPVGHSRRAPKFLRTL